MHLSIQSILGHQRHRLAAGAATLLGATGIGLAQADPSPAAGFYGHLSCDTAAPAIHDGYGGWSAFSTANVPGMDTANQCSSGGLWARMYTGASGAIAPLGSNLGWKFSAPAGTYVAGANFAMSGWLRAFQTPDAQQTDQGVLQVASDTGALRNYTSTDNGSINGGTTVALSGLNTASLTVRVICDGIAGDDGCYYDTGTFTMRSPHITLGDDLAPSIGTVSGAASTATRWVGNQPLAYAATDNGSGVARFRLYVDGSQGVDHVVDNSTGHCQVISTNNGNWVFGHSRPCPTSVNTTESIDSTQIADGQHTIVAKVLDAAQREATVMNRSAILVANHPPVNTTAPDFTPETLSFVSAPKVDLPMAVKDHGNWTGPNLTFVESWQRCDAGGTGCAQIPSANAVIYTPTTADVGHTLRYAVTASNPADSVTAYTAVTGVVTNANSVTGPTTKPTDGANGSHGSNGSNGAAASAAPVPPPLPAAAPGAEHLANGHVSGEPVGVACPDEQAVLVFEHVKGNSMKLSHGKSSSAQLQLTCKNTGKPITGAKLDIATQIVGQAAVASDVTTDGAGHATLRLAKGASRGITVGYRMFGDDPIARATATLKVLVLSRITLKANKKTLRNGQAVTLKGSVAGGLVPKRGVALAVQWKDGKRWRPFAQIKTNTKGVFKYAYKFTRTNRTIRYALRVHVVSGQVDYPYVSTASKAIKVTVAP
ncbi:MAG: hypothetical protein QOF26_2238 [Baekduia sp.]|nr:hypothetical protein [Baekduia sp.]